MVTGKALDAFPEASKPILSPTIVNLWQSGVEEL